MTSGNASSGNDTDDNSTMKASLSLARAHDDVEEKLEAAENVSRVAPEAWLARLGELNERIRVF